MCVIDICICMSTIHRVSESTLEWILNTAFLWLCVCVCVRVCATLHRLAAGLFNPLRNKQFLLSFHSLFVCVYLDLLRCPLVQIDRFDSGDVDTQVAVDAGAADTHEHPEVP